MKLSAFWEWPAKMFLASCVLVFLSACERDSDTSEAESYFENNPYASETRTDPDPAQLTITPGIAAIAVVGQEVVFTARGGGGSYSWSVTDRSVGVVHSLRTPQCTYECRRVGYNTVIVKDSQGHYAAAQITPQEQDVEISPSSAAVHNESAINIGFAVSGGSPPYTWSSASPELGRITYSSSSSYQASYTAFAGKYGENQVTVRDSAGHTASASITQSAP